jgi:predicted deacetylase
MTAMARETPVGARATRGALAVALHDVQPATFERCALIRDWLYDLGVEKVTLLVIPAPELHPFFQRSPELAAWLLDRRDDGDAIAMHGLQHRRTRRPHPLVRPVRDFQGAAATEFPGLDADATVACLDTGRRVLEIAGVPPRGFVAPGYAYTGPLREHLDDRFDWWATLFGVRPRTAVAPALCLGTSTGFRRAASPALLRAAAALSGRLLRLDLHPADFEHPSHVHAVEAVLRRAHRRTAVTYDDLC